MRESLILDDASFCPIHYLSGALLSRFGSAKWRTIQRKVTHHTAQSETAYKAKLENSQQKTNRKFGTFGFFAYLWTHGDRSAELLHYFLSLVAFSGSEAMFSYTSTRFSSRGRVISNKARLFSISITLGFLLLEPSFVMKFCTVESWRFMKSLSKKVTLLLTIWFIVVFLKEIVLLFLRYS